MPAEPTERWRGGTGPGGGVGGVIGGGCGRGGGRPPTSGPPGRGPGGTGAGGGGVRPRSGSSPSSSRDRARDRERSRSTGRAGILCSAARHASCASRAPVGSLATCVRRQPGQASTGEEHVVAVEVHEAELRQPAEGAVVRRTPARRRAEAERSRRRPRWQGEAGRFGVEAVGQLPGEEHGARARAAGARTARHRRSGGRGRGGRAPGPPTGRTRRVPRMWGRHRSGQ